MVDFTLDETIDLLVSLRLYRHSLQNFTKIPTTNMNEPNMVSYHWKLYNNKRFAPLFRKLQRNIIRQKFKRTNSNNSITNLSKLNNLNNPSKLINNHQHLRRRIKNHSGRQSNEYLNITVKNTKSDDHPCWKKFKDDDEFI